ncbi:MAG: RnfABCDGE type electron transport complex subunit E [Candidatus Hadarchaeales archaeon]
MKEFTKGILKRNPIFYLMLGLCPTLAITTAVENALIMSAAFLFVMIPSAAIISMVRRWIPRNVRIPSFIVIIATFTTIIDLLIHGFLPRFYEVLGIFIPLIVVNCIVMGRVEAFASKNPVRESILDAAGMGIGFSAAIVVVSIIRELLGRGYVEIFGYTVIPSFTRSPIGVMILPPGAFLTIGIIIAIFKKKGLLKGV